MKKLGLALIGTLLSTNAMADLILCNDATQYDHVVYSYGTYLGEAGNTRIQTRGWLKLEPNTCQTLLFGDLRKAVDNHTFFKAFGYKNDVETELKNNEKTYQLCASLKENFTYPKASESISCSNAGGEMETFYLSSFSKESKHDVLRITNGK